jgi:hypothetical protein
MKLHHRLKIGSVRPQEDLQRSNRAVSEHQLSVLEGMAGIHHHEMRLVERLLVSDRIAVKHRAAADVVQDFIVLVRVHADEVTGLHLGAIDPADRTDPGIIGRQGETRIKDFDAKPWSMFPRIRPAEILVMVIGIFLPFRARGIVARADEHNIVPTLVTIQDADQLLAERARPVDDKFGDDLIDSGDDGSDISHATESKVVAVFGVGGGSIRRASARPGR